MNKYDEMSDFEINKLIASSIKIKFYDRCGYIEIDDALEGIRTGNDEFKEFDPCNNPADMWPIIVENDISLINDMSGNIGAAHDDYQQVWLPKDKALRAAAIIFLTIKDGGNE